MLGVNHISGKYHIHVLGLWNKLIHSTLYSLEHELPKLGNTLWVHFCASERI